MNDSRKGKLRWFNSNKGFGMVADETGQDVYLHQSDFNDSSENLHLGEDLEFEIVEGVRGPIAKKITRISL